LTDNEEAARMATVYAIQNDGSTAAMSRIRCKSEDRELQRILERNPDLLPGDQIDPDDPRRWLLLKREMPVPDPGTGSDRWSIDFLFADQDAVPTFVECKRCADTRARREIVGQMLEYAANGHHYWTRDSLREVATQTATASGSTLDDAFRRLAPTDGLSIDDYFDLVQQNLREGQLRIVFFLEDSSPELRSVVDFLNRQMERSEVLLVEARQYSHGGSTIVVPTLFGYTEEARLVKRQITVKPSTTRRRWDRTSYFADAASKLTPEQANTVESLLEYCLSLGCEITWGTGIQNGSFNVKESLICPRSLLTCYSNGDLIFNLFWLNGSEIALHAQRKLRELAAMKLNLPAGAEDRTIAVGSWTPKSQVVSEVVQEVVSDCRKLANTYEVPESERL
jgi:hypothetical protein